jgi:DNA-binding XRE family transcriptional regulator
LRTRLIVAIVIALGEMVPFTKGTQSMQREHLKDARRIKGLTAIALSGVTEIKEEKIYAVERGRYAPSREEAIAWAAALQLRPEVAFPEIFGTRGRK